MITDDLDKCKKCISVIIPTYNRAHLILSTIPTYIQENVLEVIVVNDCSSDDTSNVLKSLSEQYNSIVVVNNKINIKQTGSKNIGIEVARGEYLYFGDDDSYLTPGSLAYLLSTISIFNADIASARALYLNESETELQLLKRHNKTTALSADLVNPKNFKTDFTVITKVPIEVPYSQACFLIKAKSINKLRYSKLYMGNCFREETDFLIRCHANGLINFYDSRACQINLPRISATGGAHTSGFVVKTIFTFVNNIIFVIKNFEEISRIGNSRLIPIVVLFEPIFSKLSSGFCMIFGLKRNTRYS